MKMQTETPLVSVIIPVYNAERYLEQTVRSVQAQTMNDWEILLIDDRSSDTSGEIMRRLASEDPRIRLFFNERNYGVARTRNIGIEQSRGAFIAFLDADDCWYPEKLERQLALASQKDADIVYCSYSIIDENDKAVRKNFAVAEETSFDRMLWRSEISCSTALIRRSVLEEHRFSAEQYHEDLALWLELLAAGYCARGVSEPLAAYRMNPGSRSSNKWRSAVNRWRIYRDILHLSLAKSVTCFLRYGVSGLIKYFGPFHKL